MHSIDIGNYKLREIYNRSFFRDFLNFQKLLSPQASAKYSLRLDTFLCYLCWTTFDLWTNFYRSLLATKPENF
jgi:hypothetical protein